MKQPLSCSYKTLWILAVAWSSALLAGCAGKMPVPGGTDGVNHSFYDGREELLARLNTIQADMTEEEVFKALGHGRDNMIRMERNHIVTALYGSTFIEFSNSPHKKKSTADFLQSLYGYRLDYKAVSREHGFSSPIRVRTDEKGFDYVVTLVFCEKKLYTPPILTGGVVNKSSSGTIFDYVNPGSLLDYVPY